MNKYKIECTECNGTGVAENIGGWARPCDACHGEGDIYVELQDKMSLEDEQRMLDAITSAVHEAIAEVGIDAFKAISMFNPSKGTPVDILIDGLQYIAETTEEAHINSKAEAALNNYEIAKKLPQKKSTELALIIFDLEVAATTFETVQSTEQREAVFNASHAKLLRDAIKILNEVRGK